MILFKCLYSRMVHTCIDRSSSASGTDSDHNEYKTENNQQNVKYGVVCFACVCHTGLLNGLKYPLWAADGFAGSF